ncbi:hypothetical protein EC973_001631 [Apophysomyces ossiformis]|uniref:Uncharacterized protein n=1 Tax=Apophysomyces ossiformis TaxID=679940 RepID=A0A8H7BU00_9FUNG|nr:hypothetical protein EC973_001631 [Apophysomyces ossiformis]
MQADEVEEVLANVRGQVEDDDEFQNEEGSEQPEAELSTSMPADLSTPVSLRQGTSDEKKKKKKSKKKKSKTAGLPDAGSEMTDDYKEKYDEDVIEDPYSTDRPLGQRVEYAIWKYRKNHKFSQEKKAVFDHYLSFGGIKTGPNAFLGRATSADAPDDPDAEQDFDAANAVTDIVPEDEDSDTEIIISFSEVAQVYLGNHFVSTSRFIRLQDYIDAPLLVDAFLRYLQIRNVCPEYAEDIAKARAIAAEAKVQLPMCKRASGLLPGKFNIACSMVFEGKHKAFATIDSEWLEAAGKQSWRIDDFLSESTGMDISEAKKLIKSVLGSYKSTTGSVQYLGTEFVKIATIGSFDPESDPDHLVDVTLVEYHNPNKQHQVKFERNIVNELKEGMVMYATLYQLENGLRYVDDISLLMPNFYMEDDCANEEDF